MMTAEGVPTRKKEPKKYFRSFFSRFNGSKKTTTLSPKENEVGATSKGGSHQSSMILKLTPPSGVPPGEGSPVLLTDILTNDKLFEALNGKSLIFQAEITVDKPKDGRTKSMTVSGQVPVTLSKGVRNGKPTREVRVRGHLRRKRSNSMAAPKGFSTLGTVSSTALNENDLARKPEDYPRKSRLEQSAFQASPPNKAHFGSSRVEMKDYLGRSNTDSAIAEYTASVDDSREIPAGRIANWSPYFDFNSPMSGPTIRRNNAQFSQNWDLRENCEPPFERRSATGGPIGEKREIPTIMTSEYYEESTLLCCDENNEPPENQVNNTGNKKTEMEDAVKKAVKGVADNIQSMKTRIAKSAYITRHSPGSTEQKRTTITPHTTAIPHYEDGIQTLASPIEPYPSMIHVHDDETQTQPRHMEMKKIQNEIGEKWKHLKHLNETKIMPKIKAEAGRQKGKVMNVISKTLPKKKEGSKQSSGGDAKAVEPLLNRVDDPISPCRDRGKPQDHVQDSSLNGQVVPLLPETHPRKKEVSHDHSKGDEIPPHENLQHRNGSLPDKRSQSQPSENIEPLHKPKQSIGNQPGKRSHAKTSENVEPLHEPKALNPVTTITISRSHTRFLRYNNGYEYCEKSGKQMLTVEAPKGLYFSQEPAV